MEEYSPAIKYIKCPLNVIADMFSRMGHREDPATVTVGKSPHSTKVSTIKYKIFHSFLDDPVIAECMLNLSDEECYLNLPNASAVDSPLDIQTINKKQKEYDKLIAQVEKHRNLYFKKKLDSHSIICYSKDREQRSANWQIALPTSLVKDAVKWFHIVTGHPGSNKLLLR